MRTHPRWRQAAAIAVASVLALTACSGGDSAGGDGDTSAPAADALDNADGVTNVTFWHSMDGSNGEAVDALVKKFNAENEGKIEVKATFKGVYDDAITAYKSSVKSGETPTMTQIYDIGSRFMIDSQQVVPMQEFIDRDSYDTSDLQPNILGYYSIDEKLWSMPFNSSMPVLYYNKTAFAAAGLDPNKPPANLDELREYAEKLTIRDASGKVTQYGFNAAVYGWFVEQWNATAGQEFCDNGNGRDDKATAVNYTQDINVEILDWWNKMVADGLAPKSSRDTAEAQNTFTAGTSAMTLESTGSLRSFTDGAAGTGFELGVGNYPTAGDGSGGPIIGGASLWINGPGHSDAEKEAAWQFVQFLATPESQAFWHTNTGYFPINKKALDLPEDKEWRALYPQFDVAVKQLADTELTTATQGCLLGVMPEARKGSEDAIEGVIDGGQTPAEALEASATALAPKIKSYNDSTK